MFRKEVHIPPLRGRSAAGSIELRNGGPRIHNFPSVAPCCSTVIFLRPIASTCRTLKFVFMSCPKALVTKGNLKSMARNLEFKDNYLDQSRVPIDLFRLGGLFSFTDHTIFSRILFFHLSRTYSFVLTYTRLFEKFKS